MGKKKGQAVAKAAAAAQGARSAAAGAHVIHSGGYSSVVHAWPAAAAANAAGAAAVCCSATVQDAAMPAVRSAPAGVSRSAHPLLDAIEQQHIEQQRRQHMQLLQQRTAATAAADTGSNISSSGGSNNPDVGFWPLMRRKEVWAIAVAQYMSGWGFYGLLAWLPQFFIEHCGLQLSQLGGFTLAPYLLQAAVGASAGIMADNLIVKRNWSIKDVRVLMQVGSSAGSVCGVAFLASCHGCCCTVLLCCAMHWLLLCIISPSHHGVCLQCVQSWVLRPLNG